MIHYYFPGFPRLRIGFELIIAFLDVNYVLLLILKYHKHAYNLKCFHWLSKQISFKVDNISFGSILWFYCISSFKPLLDFLIFAHKCTCTCMSEGEALWKGFVGLYGNIRYQNWTLWVEKEIWKDLLIRMETRYNQYFQFKVLGLYETIRWSA